MKKRFFSIFLVSIMIISLTGCGKEKLDSPEKIASKYCDILVKGNYGDILDIADMPSNEFTTQEKIDGAKDNFRERFMKDNDDATSCTYTLASENDEKASYKLVINDSKTKTIDIKKSNNKVIVDDIYTNAEIKSPLGSKVTIDGIDISKYKVDGGIDHNGINTLLDYYSIVILTDYDYKIKSTHPLLTKEQVADFEDTSDGLEIEFTYFLGYGNNEYNNGVGKNLSKVSIKEEDYNSIKKLLDEAIVPLIKDNLNNNDLNKYNKYFVNNLADVKSSVNFKNLDEKFDIYLYTISGNNKIEIEVMTAKDSFSQKVMLVKDNNNWKIEKIYTDTND